MRSRPQSADQSPSRRISKSETTRVTKPFISVKSKPRCPDERLTRKTASESTTTRVTELLRQSFRGTPHRKPNRSPDSSSSRDPQLSEISTINTVKLKL